MPRKHTATEQSSFSFEPGFEIPKIDEDVPEQKLHKNIQPLDLGESPFSGVEIDGEGDEYNAREDLGRFN